MFPKCKYKNPCRIRKSSCRYFTKLLRRDTLRVQSTLQRIDDDDDNKNPKNTVTLKKHNGNSAKPVYIKQIQDIGKILW